jgi:polyribonucleotide nucleotidyltransferase
MKKIEIPSGNNSFVIEEGLLAKQSSGSAFIKCGDIAVLVTAVGAEEEKEDVSFFPLICDYREQTSAAGKIPGGFFKREGRPAEREILISRIIDRSIRPLFPKTYRKDTQVVSLVLSADQENESDIPSIIGASVALCSSRIPFAGPVGAARIGLIDGTFVWNPSVPAMEESLLELIISGTENSIIMMEGWGKEITDQKFLEAVEFGFEKVRETIKYQKDIINQNKDSQGQEFDEEMKANAEAFLENKISDVYKYPDKKQRDAFYKKIKEEFLGSFGEEKQAEASDVFEQVLETKIRKIILTSGKRLDGRANDQLRELECMVGLLPRTHGSALFTRGQTQCLASITLGTQSDEQIIDGLYQDTTKKFMLHYNFLPFSVGEVSPFRGTSRRETGHGALAEKSLAVVLPKEDEFPYTLRVLANILESNGSSSMATVCSGSLALMDGGVNIKKHVAGIALGMIKEEDDYILLTDIAGEEDHYGDLDLKIAGTEEGITGFQMDVKATGFTSEILMESLQQSTDARKKILKVMKDTIDQPRISLSPYAPRIITLKVNPDKVGLIIGQGGKTIKKITAETGAEIDILEEGEVRVSSVDQEASRKAVDIIKGLVEEPEVGKIYEGEVVKIMNFGVFVKILPSCEGLVHISELAPHHVKKVEDIVKEGDKIKVMVKGYDDKGRISLSRKRALEKEKE